MIHIRNRPRISIYSSGTTILAGNPGAAAEDLRFSNQFPGGRSQSASFFVPMSPRRQWTVGEGMRVRIENKGFCVWEGYIRKATPSSRLGKMGYTVEAVGAWAYYLMKQEILKPWADKRIDRNVWQEPSTAYNSLDISTQDKMRVDRNNRLQLTPSEVQFAASQYHRFVYPMPTTQTVKRITFNYDLQETALVSPRAVLYNDAPAGANTFTDLTLSYDGNTTTASGCTMTSDDYLYIGADPDTPWFSLIRFDMGAANVNAATLSAQYSKVDGTGAESWAALTITDGTAAAGKCLAQDGDITFTKPSDWGEITVNDTRLRWIRLKASANLTLTGFWEIYIGEVQQWLAGLLNEGTVTTIWSTGTQGTGSVDHTLATPSNKVWLYMQSLAQQTPPSNGSIYCKFTNVTVYSETGSINATEITKDIRGYVSELSTDETNISNLTVDLVPFVADPYMSAADALDEVTKYGDASFNAWASYTLPAAEYGDGKPRLALSQQPTSSSTPTYFIRSRGPNIASEFTITRSVDDVYNWFFARYRDVDGIQRTVDPNNDATLMDAASIASYGKRAYEVRVNTSSVDLIKQYAKALLARLKNLQWKVNGTIQVQSYINGAGGQEIPACEIMPGNVLMITDFAHDNGTGLAFPVTAVDYEHNTQTASLTVGYTDRLDVWLARKLKDMKQLA